jgi:lambda family phage minor tail protein L
MPRIPTDEIQKLAPSALIEVFILDARAVGGDIHYFHSGTNDLGNNVVWQGKTYVRYPVAAEGFEMRSSGSAPRPTIRVSNVGGLLGAEVRTYGDLLNAKLTRKRTFARYLDAANFRGGNREADPNVALPDEMYFVDRKKVESPEMIEWELTSLLDLVDMQIPRRQIIANVCPWRYRGTECGYAGGPVAEITDTPTSDPRKDQCGKRLASCKLRFGAQGNLRYGGFPAATLIRR